MPRIDLQVPFAEKDDAKRFGARWDAETKVWYLPDGLDLAPLRKFLPQEPDINIRAPDYFITESSESCWKCGKTTRVYGLLLPAGHETLEPIDEADAGFGSDDQFDKADFQSWLDSAESSRWSQSDDPTIIHYVTHISPSVITHIQRLTRSYRVDFSKTTQSSYLMNHCEHCGMKQGDFSMYCEPQGAFFSLNQQDASRIVLHLVPEPFHGDFGSYSYGVELIEYMRKA